MLVKIRPQEPWLHISISRISVALPLVGNFPMEERMKQYISILTAFSIFMIVGCQGNNLVTTELPVLKDVYKNSFMIGTALNGRQISGHDAKTLNLALQQFNTFTAENVLKWERVHPEFEEYKFDLPDRFVELGIKNNIFLVGHTLLWHNQTPDWVLKMLRAIRSRGMCFYSGSKTISSLWLDAIKVTSKVGMWLTKLSKTMAACAKPNGRPSSVKTTSKKHFSLPTKPIRRRSFIITISTCGREKASRCESG